MSGPQPLSEETREAMRGLLERYPEPRSALLPMLYLVQAEQGWVSGEGIAEAARLLGLTKAEVAAVSTFYTMFKREPLGEYLVSVCTQPPCALAGGERILRRLEDECGIRRGATTDDGRISLEEVECLCACDGAPVLQVNYVNYERLDEEGAVALIEGLREGTVPPPARGELPAGRAETHRRLAGLDGAPAGSARDGAGAKPKGGR